ncbi:hypothetical protein Tco_0324124 [Tanacetum coccineum]
MEEIFDQMNNEVDKNTVDKQCAEIEKKNLLIENENLIVNCLSTQLLYDVEKSRCLDLEADMSKEAPDFNSFFKIKNLEHQIKEKDNVIRHLKDLVASVNDRSREPYNAVDVTALIEQNDCEEIKEPCFITSDYVTKPKVLAPGMILPAKKEVEVRLRTNKSVWTKVNPVDSSISSKRVVINSNSESVCKTCNKCVNSASHGMCVVNILKSVNATPTVRIVLNNEKQIWKPKGKLSDNSLNKTKQIWKPKDKLSDNSLNKAPSDLETKRQLFYKQFVQDQTGLESYGKTICRYWLSMETHRKETRLRKT